MNTREKKALADAKKIVVANAEEKYKSERGRNAFVERTMKEYESAINSTFEVVQFRAVAEWHHSHTWGMCPRVEVWVWLRDVNGGETVCKHGTGYASGYGYDKLSSAIASATDHNVWHYTLKKHHKRVKDLYGVRLADEYCPFDSISWACKGVSVIRQLFNVLGGEYSHHEGKTYDCIEWTSNSELKRERERQKQARKMWKGHNN